MLGGLVLSALVNSAAMLAVPAVAVWILFTPAVGIPVALLLLVGIGFSTARFLRIATGRRQVPAGVLASLAAVTTAVVVLAQTERIPVNWVPWLELDIGVLAGGPISAAAAALALPRWRIRLLGAVIILVAVGIVAVPAAIASAEQRAAEQERDRLASEQLLEQRLDVLERPVTTDWAGVRTERISAGSEWISLVRIGTVDGAAMEIRAVGDSPDRGREELACALMAPTGGMFDESVTMESFAGVCEAVDGETWRLVDGSAVAVTFEGRLVILASLTSERVIASLGGERPATPEELAAAAAQLRTLTRAEFRQALLSPR